MNWKKLLLIGSVAGLLAFVPVQRSDAGVSVGIGIGYPGYYGYYPYGYYRPYPYYGLLSALLLARRPPLLLPAPASLLSAVISWSNI